METSETITLMNSLLGGACLGIISGLFGCLAKWILEFKNYSATIALLVGTLVGALTGTTFIFAVDGHTTPMLLTCFVAGAIIPWLSSTNIFQSPPPEDLDLDAN